MATVNLYIEIVAHGPRRQNGAYGWVLEMVRQDGTPDPRTLHNIGFLDDATDRDMVLIAIPDALDHVRADCEVSIMLGPEYLMETFPAPWLNGWIINWRSNGWKNAQGKDVVNADLWKKCDAVLRNKNAVFGSKYQRNPYKDWIRSEIDRVLRNKTGVSAESEICKAAENGDSLKAERAS